MPKLRHEGEHPVNCPFCITVAERTRAWWQKSYLDVFSSGAGKSIEAKHKAELQAALRRQKRG